MHHPILAACAATMLAATAALTDPLVAQTASPRTHEEMRAAYEAHQRDFDYLLGDWEFEAQSLEYGRFRGRWSAVRLPGGQILDEYRVLGEDGETYYVTTTLRNFNAALDRWELVGMEPGNGLQDMGTARLVGDEMHLEQRFGVMSDQPSIWRIRYYDIRAARFSWTADRSHDGGITWERGHMRIEARRVGPARQLEPLTPGS